jgi:sialic acid synthase SpsE
MASVDLNNLNLIKKIGETKKPLILSTGMSNLSNIIESIDTFKRTGNPNLILLHCVSSYPASEKEANLNVITNLKNYFRIPIGLSDHYPGIEISLMALAKGANIIERHFTLDKKMEGPDHILSSNLFEMKKLVQFAKNTTAILGDGEKKIQPSEYEVINTQKKCIYAKKNLKKNTIIKKNDIIIKGPAGGLNPRYSNLIIGKKITKNLQKDYPFTWEHFFK